MYTNDTVKWTDGKDTRYVKLFPTFSPRSARLTVQIATQISSVATTRPVFGPMPDQRLLDNPKTSTGRLSNDVYMYFRLSIFPLCFLVHHTAHFYCSGPISTDFDLLRRKKREGARMIRKKEILYNSLSHFKITFDHIKRLKDLCYLLYLHYSIYN